MKHKHHNPPKHRVGNHNNVIEVSVIQHSMFHYCEWKLHGFYEDFVAWKSLANLIGKEQLFLKTSSIGGKNNKGKLKSKKHKEKISKTLKKHYTLPESKTKISKAMKNNVNSKNHSSKNYKEKQSLAMKKAWARKKAKLNNS